MEEGILIRLLIGKIQKIPVTGCAGISSDNRLTESLGGLAQNPMVLPWAGTTQDHFNPLPALVSHLM